MARNVQVIHADGLAEFFQGGKHGAVVLRGLGALGEHLQAAVYP